jgi:hypothetical protein
VHDAAIYRRLRDGGIDHPLAMHVAHLFIRDSVSLFSEKVHQDDANDTDHFEVPILKPDHKNKKNSHFCGKSMELRNTHFFHIKFLDRTNIKCQNGPVLPPAQVFYFNGQALHTYI